MADGQQAGGLFCRVNDLPSAPWLWDDRDARPPRMAAEAVGDGWEGGRFDLSVVGDSYVVDFGSRRIWNSDRPEQRVRYQAGVVLLLTTLAKSQGVPSSGRMVTPLELPGDALFFTGAQAVANRPLGEAFGVEPQRLLDRGPKSWGPRRSRVLTSLCIYQACPGVPFMSCSGGVTLN
ncbi:hypothetical protein DFAR_2450006 [Desulfarculales bacterium]